MMRVEAFGTSDIGQRRENNEDHYVIDESLNLYIVCDGMGGHAAGEVASENAVEFAARHIRENRETVRNARKKPEGYYRVLELAEDAVEEASRQLHDLACSDAQYAGMGTTMTALLVVDDKGIVSHVGDTRLYLQRLEDLHVLTSDHTLANELVQMGGLRKGDAEKGGFTNVLTRSIGTHKAVQVDSLMFDLFPGDTFLLCSDGLSRYLEDRAELSRYLKSEDLDGIPQKLVQLANSRGGKDNITAIVARVEADPAEKCPSPEEFQRCMEVLKSVFLFKELSLGRLIRVLNIASVDDYEAGSRIIAAGDNCDGIHIVLEGRLEVAGDGGVEEELIGGQCFGVTSLLHKHTSAATVEAAEPSRVLFIRGRDFDNLTRRRPKLGRLILRRLALHLSERLQRLMESRFDPESTDHRVT